MPDQSDRPILPEGVVERLAAARWRLRPVSYAPLVPRPARGAPALPVERRARARAVTSPRGVLVDLVA